MRTAEETAAKNRKYYLEHKEALRESHKLYSQTAAGKAMRASYLATDAAKVKRRQHQQAYWAKLKQTIMAEYGGRCVCCGEGGIEFLSIDHINGDGANHRREIGAGVQFYQWLKRNGYPKENYQILCMNCNCAKGRYGYCPHKENRRCA